MAKPAPYSGSVEDCNGFLLQCSLVLEMQPHMFPTERSKVTFLITQLSGKALLWAESIWSQNHPAVQSYSSFIDYFKEVFKKPSWDSSIAPFSDVFCPKRASKLPPHRPWDCAIDLLPEEKAMEEYIEEALAQGYIRPSTSPSASSFFFVAKKDGGLRPCIDYRALNHITVKFSTYNLIRIRKGDEWKTAFVTPTGHYEYLVMPYGLVNAPSIFQDFIHKVLREFLHKFILVYINDILIYSRNLAEHRHHVAEVLKRLREFQLFLKAEKCSFHQHSVQFLGYNIDSSGIRMDKGKVAAIKDWPMPTTVKELQRFLGFANFYRRFIQNYSSISNPLTSLLRNKPKSLSWATSAKEAFNTLKEAFTTAPLLVHPDPDKPFIVEVDASTTGVGAVLSQQQGNPSRLHPCAAFSRKLNPAEVNYDIGNRELPGSKNTKADALSRLFTPEENTVEPETILPEKVIVSPITWSEETLPSTNASTNTPPGCPPGLQYITRARPTPLIHSAHTSLGTGHPGVNETLSLLKDRFWWPKMASDVRRYVQGWTMEGAPYGAMETAELMFNHIFRYFGIPEDIVSDRGPQFISRVWKAFFSCLGVAVSLSSGYHPQMNGQTERKIQEIGHYLRTFCHGHQDSWNQYLGWPVPLCIPTDLPFVEEEDHHDVRVRGPQERAVGRGWEWDPDPLVPAGSSFATGDTGHHHLHAQKEMCGSGILIHWYLLALLLPLVILVIIICMLRKKCGDEEVMGKFGVKKRNLEGQMVVDFAKRMDMGVVNTYFQKREEHRVTYKSGGRSTQVDYILCRRGNLKEISDCKVVVGESVARQHRMVVCRMTLMVCKKKRSEIEKKTKWWKLKKEECCEEFRQKLRQALGGQVVLPDDWETTAEVIRETGRKVLGVSYGRRKEDKETWWWNEEVQDSIQRKKLAKKKWDMDRTEENRQEYKELQRRVTREVSKANQKAYDELYTRLDTREGEKDLYRLARQRDRDGKDVQQVRVIKDRDGRVLTSEENVQRRWKEYFEELMNEENEREKRVEGVNSVEQKVDKIRKDEVRKALKRMKSGKAVGPDDIPVEVWKCLGEAAVEFLASLFNRVLENLEKAYDRVPREELWYCMRKSGVAEKYVRVVQDMYERSRTVVRCAVGQTEEFKVEVGLHKGSALRPFLFAIVMDQLSEKVRQESPWTMMFADDIVICSESREQVEENLERWRFALERRGMKVSRSKTEYMCVNEREGSGTVRLQGEEVKKVQEFKYLGSTVQSNGECGKEVKKRVQAGWNGWRKVSGVLCDRKISARIKGKVYRTVVRPAMLYGLETVSLRKRQESELEVAELKMLRFSLGVTRLDRIRNEYIRGTAHVGRLGDKVREARLRWFGHVQRRETELREIIVRQGAIIRSYQDQLADMQAQLS
ncbi:hypothetical protein QTP70_000954 [Hemibagrus guttatus]|uniref:Gypsy retrotransposon integrase-like protein 1 n=1 Tax=Hemibagrus guttatus TaxID=175788 RepID=A0AAE0Q322_9TELE|nr:hypothetical protein QTP70_000954 [Hemibagrus guttatus]